MSIYDYHGICPLCGNPINWTNGKTNYGVIMIRTKRKTTDYYHRDCIEKERKACAAKHT